MIVSVLQVAVAHAIAGAEADLYGSASMVKRLHRAVRDGHLEATDRLLALGFEQQQIDTVLGRCDALPCGTAPLGPHLPPIKPCA